MAVNLGPPFGMTKAEWEAWQAAHPNRNSVTDDPVTVHAVIDEHEEVSRWRQIRTGQVPT